MCAPKLCGYPHDLIILVCSAVFCWVSGSIYRLGSKLVPHARQGQEVVWTSFSKHTDGIGPIYINPRAVVSAAHTPCFPRVTHPFTLHHCYTLCLQCHVQIVTHSKTVDTV